MTTEVAMPKLGLLMTEGEVVRWLVGDGQPIEQGKPIVNIMTKKINYQVAAPASGILYHAARVNAKVLIGKPLAYIVAPGEPAPIISQPDAPPEPMSSPDLARSTTVRAPMRPPAGSYLPRPRRDAWRSKWVSSFPMCTAAPRMAASSSAMCCASPSSARAPGRRPRRRHPVACRRVPSPSPASGEQSRSA